MAPIRQIEMVELMVAVNDFSVAYAKSLVAMTAQEHLVQGEPSKKDVGMRPEDISRIEREMQSIEGDFKTIQETHGRNMLNLVVSVGYVRRLLENAAVVKYLSRKYADLLGELERTVESTDLRDDAGSVDARPSRDAPLGAGA